MGDTKTAKIAETVASTRTYPPATSPWKENSPQRWTWEDLANPQLFKFSMVPAVDEEGRRLVDPHTQKPLLCMNIQVINAVYPNEKRGAHEFVTINKWDATRKRTWPVTIGTMDGMEVELSLELSFRPPRQQRLERDLGTIAS
jgi:hypothetical protein